MEEAPKLSLDDFRTAKVNDFVGDASDEETGLFTSLSNAAKAVETTDSKSHKVYQLLASVTSMSLDADSLQMPFVPFWQGADGRCSAHIDCFSPEEMNFFAEILPEVTDVRLSARLNDLLWVRSETRHINYARGAIDAYRQFPFTPRTSFENRNAWERAIRLCHSIGSGSETRLSDIRVDLLRLLDSSSYADKRYALDLSRLLQISGIEKSQVTLIISKLENLICDAETEGDPNWIRGFCEETIVWYRKGNQDEDVCRLTVKIAESWVAEADAANMHMVKGSHYVSAIEAYRSISKPFREQFGVESRLKVLETEMAKSNRLSLDELGEIRSDGLDITEWIEQSKRHVQGKECAEAILAFANILPIGKVADLESQAKDEIKRYPLQALLGATHMGGDGRVIAKTPGLDLSGSDPNATESVTWQKMINNKLNHVGLIVQGVIFPALSVITLEHRITEADLLFLCRNSAIVPRDRAGLWAKGLYYGFEEKFIESTHILPFQVEHWIRVELKMRNHKTTVLKDGVETEKGLSTLLDDEHISEVLDENLLFELKAVLTDHLGPNFRNNVAHGLMDPREGLTAHPMYLWWLCLKLVVNNVPWKPQPTGDNDSTSEESSEE